MSLITIRFVAFDRQIALFTLKKTLNYQNNITGKLSGQNKRILQSKTQKRYYTRSDLYLLKTYFCKFDLKMTF